MAAFAYGESLTAHLAAVAGVEADPVRTPAWSRPLAASTGLSSGELHEGRAGAAGLAAVVWRAGVEADGTPPDQVQPLRNEGPGAVYLHGRGAWPGSVAALRWLPADAAARIGLRPRLPDGAAGALLYRFAAPGEVCTAAVQCEAVNAGGERVTFGGGVGKRPSVTGSDFDGGRRVFVARDGEGPGVNLAEGPIDALAAATLAAAGIERRALGGRGGLAGAGDVVGASGRTGTAGGGAPRGGAGTGRRWNGPAGSGASSWRRPAWTGRTWRPSRPRSGRRYAMHERDPGSEDREDAEHEAAGGRRRWWCRSARLAR